MNPGAPTPRRSPIFYEILAYFADHPQAQDTVEGIVEWWLLEQRIKRATTQVKAVLAQLVAEGLVIPRDGTAGRVYYPCQPAEDARDSPSAEELEQN